MSWAFLIIAGLMEVVGVVAMKKYSLNGAKIFLLGIFVQFAISFSFLSLAMQEIAMATAYAIWTGIGAAGGVAVSVLFLGESKSVKKLFFITLIIIAVVGLKLVE